MRWYYQFWIIKHLKIKITKAITWLRSQKQVFEITKEPKKKCPKINPEWFCPWTIDPPFLPDPHNTNSQYTWGATWACWCLGVPGEIMVNVESIRSNIGKHSGSSTSQTIKIFQLFMCKKRKKIVNLVFLFHQHEQS